MRSLNIAILASGGGTILPPIIKAIEKKQLNAKINLIISNKCDALILKRAKQYKINATCIPSKYKIRAQHEQQISSMLQQRDIDLILLIGYMRILSSDFVKVWHNKIMNVHPSLLPSFAGLMDLEVHQAVLEAGIAETGCTVHFVSEEVDKGPIIVQKKCAVLKDDTPQSLKIRVQQLEGLVYVEAIKKFEKNKQDK